MTRSAKTLLVIEVVLCFGPVLVMLLLGLLIIPVSLVMDPKHAADNLDDLGMVIGGVLGMFGLGVIVKALMSGTPPRISRPVILVCTVLGIASLLPLVFGSVDSWWWRLIGLLPILAAAHLIYLVRRHLFDMRPHGK